MWNEFIDLEKGQTEEKRGRTVGKYAFRDWEEGRSESEELEDSIVTSNKWKVDF